MSTIKISLPMDNLPTLFEEWINTHEFKALDKSGRRLDSKAIAEQFGAHIASLVVDYSHMDEDT